MSDYHFDFHIQGERAEHYIKHVAIPCVATRSTSGLKVSGVAQLQADHSESATSVLKSLAVFERRVGCRERGNFGMGDLQPFIPLENDK